MKNILRYGSHSEKEYFEKMLRFFDGIIFSANLLESTPSATISLISKFSGRKRAIPYIIDPMTYSFGEVYNYKTGLKENKLRWIMSESKKGLAIKKSYKKLADSLGDKFQESTEIKRAISLKDLKNEQIRKSICKSVINYQEKRVVEILQEDKKFFDFAEDIPRPTMIFAPYFFIHPKQELEWLDVIEKISIDSEHYIRDSLYIKLCFDKSMLFNKSAIKKIVDICEQNFKGIWIWINNFDERQVSIEELKAFQNLIQEISKKGKEVFNRHGGFYSFILSKFGMTGASNSIGYGEKRDIMPVLGQGLPLINYYLSKLHSPFGVPEIERSFDELHIDSPESFFKHICDCVICKGVIKEDIFNFKEFGTQHLSTPTSRKKILTPAATKRARYHYLLCKIREKKDIINTSSVGEIVEELKRSLSIAKIDVLKDKSKHISKWIQSLNT